MRNVFISLAVSLAVLSGASASAQVAVNKKPPMKLSEVPNKVALANWVKARPVDKAKQLKTVHGLNSIAASVAAKADATTKVQKFKCALLYSDSWDEDSYQYGAYSFSLDNVDSFTKLYTNTSAPANGGGFFTDDKFYFTSYSVDDWGWDYEVKTYVVDTETWKVLETVDQGTMYAMASDLAYDPIEKKAFGTFYSGSDSGSYWGYMDPSDCSVTQIAELDGSIVAVAANNQGEIYGITSGGHLVKIDKYSGKLTDIGNTNISPYYMQSAAFDENGTFYWAASFTDGSTGLFTVNLETAKVTLLSAFTNEEEITALYAEPAAADEGAPAEATNLALSFNADALTGKFSFDVPAVDNTGATITGNVNYIVNIDGTDAATGTAEAGTTATVDVTVASAGVHSFNVRLSNDKGESKRVAISQWVGIDRPVAVTDLKLEKTGDLQATLTWTAPTKGALDGYFDASRISYTVTRLPENVVVVSDLKATTYVDNLESDKKVYHTYAVTAYADNVAGASATSNGAVFGHALTTPVEFNFDTEADYNIFTVIDNNETVSEDSGMWQYTASGQCAGYVSGTKDGDDWLITPEITLKSDRQYTFTYDVLCYSDYWPDKYEVYIGKDATIEAMTTKLVEPTTIYWDEYRTATVTITVPEDGNYNIGFHALSEAGGAFFLVDNIKLVDSYVLKAPAAVSSLAVTAGAKGALTASVAFTTPNKAVDGSDITELTAVNVYRGTTLVKTFDAPAVNTQLTFDDTDLQQGFANYTVVAVNAAGNGVEAADSAWVGNDTPTEPVNVKVKVSETHPVITWEAPGEVGQNGGYVDPAKLTYIVYRASDSSILSQGFNEKSFIDEDTEISEEGAQAMKMYSVYAQSSDLASADNKGIGYSESAYVISGKNYTLPFTESFKNGSSNKLWLSNGTYEDYWQISDDWSASPQDNDGGELLITPYTPGSVSSFMSGKIALTGSKNATLSFYLNPMSYESNGFDETDPADDYLEVIVGSSNYDFSVVKTIRPNDLTKGSYQKISIPLTDYEGADFITFGFKLHSVAAMSPMAIDNISIVNNYDVNMAVEALTLPESVSITKTFDAVVTVKNDASKEANGFTVQIKRGNEVVASTTETTALEAAATRDYTFTLTALPTWGDSETFVAEVTIEGDELASDNTATASVDMVRADMVAATNLAYSVDGAGQAVFTWNAPEIAAYTTVNEGFESYKHGEYKTIGDWTLVDEDGVYGFDDFYDNGEYVDVPHPFSPQSFMVFNPTTAGASTWAAHSGNQMVCSFANWENDNDDWLISPRLSGRAQTISFWARTPKSDKIVVYGSTTGKSTDDFTRLDEGRVTLKTEWTKYTFELEAGTTYFAIRNSNTSGYVVMLDDFEFEVAASWDVEPVVEGYNLYKDNVRVNDEVITSTTYTVADNIAGTYYVTAVYNIGESDASNSVIVELSGIENVAVDGNDNLPVYDIYGHRVTTLQPGHIYFRKGQKFIYQEK
jgi:hypothetical protein